MQLDHDLVNSLAFLNSLDKLLEQKQDELLNVDRVLQVLSVDYRNVETLLIAQGRQSSEEFMYNLLAAKLNKICSDYKDTVFEKYMAHCRGFANLYLDAGDIKNTLSALQDAVILLFSKDRIRDEQLMYAKLCFDQYYSQTYSKKNLDGLIENFEEYKINLGRFHDNMYQFKIKSGMDYEDFILQQNRLEHYKAQAEALAKAMNNVGICSTNCVKLKLSGYTGEVPKVSGDVINKLLALRNSNPTLSSDELAKIWNDVTEKNHGIRS